MDFFDEYKDKAEYDALFAMIQGLMGVITIGLLVVMPASRLDLLAYALMTLIVVIVGYIETITDINRLQDYLTDVVALGSNARNIILGTIVGIAIGYFLTARPSVIGIPATAGLTNTNALIMVGLLAPFWETLFFVGIIAPTLIKQFRMFNETIGDLAGVALASASFGLYHFLAYGGSTELMMSAAVFCAISVVLTYFFKSIAPALGIHYAVNISWLMRNGYL